MDYSKFRAPYIPFDTIRKKADDFRSQYSDTNDIPIEIEKIIELDLGLEIRPIAGLSDTADVDALLLGDLKTIVIDSAKYMEDRHQNRLRYSLAHELGHLVLHEEIYNIISHETIDDWTRFFQEIPLREYTWIEQHAYEFAGRLLVPPDILQRKLNAQIEVAEIKGFKEWDQSGEIAIDYIASTIDKDFGVSPYVISKRIKIEKMWPFQS